MPTGFRFRRRKAWGFKSLLVHCRRGFQPRPVEVSPFGDHVIQRGPTPDFWGPDPKRFAMRVQFADLN